MGYGLHMGIANLFSTPHHRGQIHVVQSLRYGLKRLSPQKVYVLGWQSEGAQLTCRPTYSYTRAAVLHVQHD